MIDFITETASLTVLSLTQVPYETLSVSPTECLILPPQITTSRAIDHSQTRLKSALKTVDHEI